MEHPKRRLAAVWFADIVGYSELSNHDEPAALRLVTLLQTLCGEVVATYEGRVVKFIGDACLAEFASTDSAVRSAIDLQERFGAGAAEQGRSAQLRIGVHLGEVNAAPDGDLYGDGINTASRLHHTAEPGRVVISEDVWRLLRQRPEFRFAPLGAVELRGITTRVEVYDVLFGSRAALASAPPPVAVAPPPEAGSKVPWLVAIAVVAIGVAGTAYWRSTRESPPPAAQPAPSVSVPDVQRPASVRSEPPPAPPSKAPTPRPSPATTTLPAPPPSRGLPPATPRGGSSPADRAAFHPAAVRALLEKLAVAGMSENPRDAIAALGPGAIPLSGRGVQQIRDSFGEGLALRVGRIEPLATTDQLLTIRFFLLAKSKTRAEMPLVFTASIDKTAAGELRFTELRREFDGRRGGRGPSLRGDQR